jgi:hypothetical protein
MSEREVNKRPDGLRPDVPWVDPATDEHWLTRPATIRKLWWAFGIVLALTVLAQFFIPVKGNFPAEKSFGFGAWYGFACCVAMVLVAKALGWWLKKPEDYYERDQGRGQGSPEAGADAGNATPTGGADDA